MPSETLLFPTRRVQRTTWGQRLALCLGTAMCLGACATPPPTMTAAVPQPTVEPPQPVAPPVARPPAVPPALSAGRSVAPAVDTTAPVTLSSVMIFADRLRGLSNSELAQELTALGEPGTVPSLQLQTALVLMHLHQPAASARALGLLQRMATHPAPESAPFKPLARLLANNLSDQKRLEDTVDRQAQQLRESQRRIEVLSDRLDAMRDIERSLTPRAPAPGTGRVPAP